MSKSNTYENNLLKLIFTAVPIANLADDAASSPATTLTVALHTADPGETGDQTTSEISYTGYARVTVARTTGGWTVTGNSVSPVASIDFPTSTGGTGGTATHWSVGTGVSDDVLYRGAISPTIPVTTGTLPRLAAGSAITED
jgi:hypothetical protein